MDKKIISIIFVVIILVAGFFAWKVFMRDISAVKNSVPLQNEPTPQGNAQEKPEAVLPQGTSTGGTVYEHATADFRLTYPSDWIAQDDITPEIVAFFLSPRESDKDTFGENVIVRYVNATSTMDLAQFTDLMLEQEKVRFPEGSFSLSSREPVTLSGLPAERLAYDVSKVVDGSRNGKAVSLITIKDKIGYVVTYGAAEDAYDKFLEGANMIFNSFEIINSSTQ